MDNSNYLVGMLMPGPAQTGPGVPGYLGASNVHIMTDYGPVPADGRFLDPNHYPVLFRTIRYTYGRRDDLFKTPNYSGKVELTRAVVGLAPTQMPNHSHNIMPNPAPNHVHTIAPWYSGVTKDMVVGFDPASSKFDPSLVIGHVQRFSEDDRGLHVTMKLDSSAFKRGFRKSLDTRIWALIDESMSQQTVTANEARAMFGLQPLAAEMSPNLEHLFPDFHGLRGMSCGARRNSSSTNKENNSMTHGTRTLQTPSKNIKRKDLSVALRLGGLARNEDGLFDILALVQSVADNERVYRVSEVKPADVIGKNVRIHRTGASGMCSDFVKDELRDYEARLVVAGKLETIDGDNFLIISEVAIPEDDEPLGEDTLRVVND